MTAVTIILDVDLNPPLRGVPFEDRIDVQSTVTFSRIPGGMMSGKSSVAISAQLPDGKYVFIQTSMANFEAVATAFRAAQERDKNKGN